MYPKLWSGATSAGVQRPVSFASNKSAGTTFSDPSSATPKNVGIQQPSSLASKGGFQSSPVVVEVPSSAPIVYRRKAKVVYDQQQSIAGNSCLQPAQDISGVPVDSSALQPVQRVSTSPVASSDLQSDHFASVPNVSGGSDQSIHDGSASSVPDHAVFDSDPSGEPSHSAATSSSVSVNVQSRNQAGKKLGIL
ncbi:hypothetical protein V6N11_024365 [Hibiscus sabdariffa]|uniref:Uncharacterized protein n=1 Tax=Hibiscus sabdariffa TaxID=183260 RepID=A0ABR2NEX6_9ROSI